MTAHVLGWVLSELSLNRKVVLATASIRIRGFKGIAAGVDHIERLVSVETGQKLATA